MKHFIITGIDNDDKRINIFADNRKFKSRPYAMQVLRKWSKFFTGHAELLCEEIEIKTKDELIDDFRSLVKEAIPWIGSFHRSRHHTDLNNGQNYARIDWLEKAEKIT